MQVALYARVSTTHQQQEDTIASQVRLLKAYIHEQHWHLLPHHEFLDEGISGARLDRPALDRLRDGAQRGEFDAVVVVSPDRLARNYAHQWLLIEEFEKQHTPLIFLQNPFGDTPQGKLLTQLQGMIAEYERAQILERTRRGRLEKARRGEFIPWAYHCYGYRYLPKRHGCPPQVMIEPIEAEVVRQLYRALVEEHLTCRQITKRLNEAQIPTPTGHNTVWQAATVSNILTHRVYAGQARYNYRQPGLPRYRKHAGAPHRTLKTGRHYRPESDWIWSDAPPLISPELFEKAQVQLQRNAAAARKLYQPSSHRYLLRTLVKGGDCGLAMNCSRQPSVNKRSEYLYYTCRGHQPLNCGRATKCASRQVRADRLDALVWQALCHLLDTPSVIPSLHQTWVQAHQQDQVAVVAQQTQLLQRRQRLERQQQRLLDAYQTEVISLSELQARRQKLTAELQQLEQENQHLVQAQQRAFHWQQVTENAETFRRLLGDKLEQLAFEQRQAVAQCLIQKVVVTGDQVDIYYVLPFEYPPQVMPRQTEVPEGTPGHFYRLRLADVGVILIGMVGFNLLLGSQNRQFALGPIGVYTPLIVLLYAAAVRTVFRYEQRQLKEYVTEAIERYPDITLRQALWRYALAASVVVAMGVWLPFLGEQMAAVMGWHQSFVGTLLVGFATSVPELVVTIAAVRLGALDLAIGNLLGSNLFDMLIVAVDDLFFLHGPILSHVAPVHAVSAFSAMMMTGVAIVGLLYRPRGRLFKTVGWVSLFLFSLYLLNSYVLYLYGE